MNFLTGRIAGVDGASTRIAVAGGEVTLPRAVSLAAGTEVTFGVRPEHIEIGAEQGAKLTDINIELVENLGGQTVLYSVTRDGTALTIVLDGQHQIAAGTDAAAYFDPERAHVFGPDGRVA
jgi:multiple sugar transport system ATP-binding protein